MARLSEADRITEYNEQMALAAFEQALAGLSDPRRRQGVRYPLRTVVVTALMSMICGCDDAEAMEAWSEANAEWLETFLDLPHGPPSQDVYLHVFGALEPRAFNEVFQRWADLVSLRIHGSERHIAIDGKTSRGSADPSTNRPAIHTVSAWLCGEGLVLGQLKTSDKSNEIKAIPELLSVISISGATITIDAMGCQREIAEAIIDGGGNYILAVKSNQPLLHRQVQDTFVELDDPRHRALDETPRPQAETFEETTKDHGRIETRRIRVTRDLAWVVSQERWKGLSFVAEVTRERMLVRGGRTTTETAWFIGSGQVGSAERVARAIRNHWGIENELHWTLDMAFNEDRARHRARNTAANIATLRHFALSIIKRDPNRKLGVANARKIAGFKRDYLVKLIGLATEN